MDLEENALRAVEVRKDASIEAQLALINEAIAGLDSAWYPSVGEPASPALFIVGLPRSGTTLLAQLLTHRFHFTYADNIVARFWRAPAVGLAISRSLRQQCSVCGSGAFSSRHGVTQRPFDPHEFGYFWARFFDFSESHSLDERQRAQVDWSKLLGALGRFERAGGGHPLLLRAVVLGLIADAVALAMPTAHFLEIRRAPDAVAASILSARAERYGDTRVWWSLRPLEYRRFAALPPEESVSAQVAACRRLLDQAMSRVPSKRRVTIRYETMCTDPGGTLERIADWLPASLVEKAGSLPRLEARRSGRTPTLRRLSRYIDHWSALLAEEGYGAYHQS